ncbi:MAG: hypothetical protein JSV50_00795 [Desulfobacteraceae bacterium]|nr:MAG: hypothetical protein JSV50_00795 [Desulfobacteraceae bacterium]
MSLRKQSGDDGSGSSDEREYSSAVFLCPRCNNVFVVRPFKIQPGEGKCPRCGQATDHFVKKE